MGLNVWAPGLVCAPRTCRVEEDDLRSIRGMGDPSSTWNAECSVHDYAFLECYKS